VRQIAHEEATKFSHNNQVLRRLTLQRQRLDTSSTCLLVINYLAALLFGEVNVLHTRIELVVDVIKSTGAPSWLNLFFNGPSLHRFLTIMMQKLPQHLLRTSFHHHLVENWMNGELQGFCVIWHNCRNPSLGLATKARVCKVVGQEGSWESHNILSRM
jgi:hypothetical protein